MTEFEGNLFMLVVGVVNSHFVYDCTLIAVDATSLRGRINQHWSARFLVLTQVATGVPRTTELTRPSVSSEGTGGNCRKTSSVESFQNVSDEYTLIYHVCRAGNISPCSPTERQIPFHSFHPSTFFNEIRGA